MAAINKDYVDSENIANAGIAQANTAIAPSTLMPLYWRFWICSAVFTFIAILDYALFSNSWHTVYSDGTSESTFRAMLLSTQTLLVILCVHEVMEGATDRAWKIVKMMATLCLILFCVGIGGFAAYLTALYGVEPVLNEAANVAASSEGLEMNWGGEVVTEPEPVLAEGSATEEVSSIAKFRPYILYSVFLSTLLAFPIITYLALSMLKSAKEAFDLITMNKAKAKSLLGPANSIKRNNSELANIDAELTQLKNLSKNKNTEISTIIAVKYIDGLNYGQRLLNNRKLYAGDDDACERAMQGEFGNSMAETHLFLLDEDVLKEMLEKCLPLADYNRIESIVSKTLH